MDRFNRLRAAVASSLAELQRAIKGLVVMSGELEGVYNSMLNNQVGSGVLRVRWCVGWGAVPPARLGLS